MLRKKAFVTVYELKKMYAVYYFLSIAQISGRSVVNTLRKSMKNIRKQTTTKAKVGKIIVSLRCSFSEDDNDVTQRRLH